THPDPRFASATARERWDAPWAKESVPRPEKSRRHRGRARLMILGRCRHSQRKYRFLATCTRGFSPSANFLEALGFSRTSRGPPKGGNYGKLWADRAAVVKNGIV